MRLAFLFLLSTPFASACPKECKCSGLDVHCEGKELTEIPGNIPIAATNLYFANNELTSLSKTDFHDLPNLQYLDVQNNSIRNVEENLLDSIPGLKYLDISKNKIRWIPKLSTAPNALVNLNLGMNEISKVDSDLISNSPYLQTFLLHRNRVQSLPHDFFNNRMVPTLKTVKMAGNPWSCDCRLTHLKQFANALFAHSNQNMFVLGKCYFPKDLRNQVFRNLSIDDLKCEKPEITKTENGMYKMSCPNNEMEAYHYDPIFLENNKNARHTAHFSRDKDGSLLSNGQFTRNYQCAFYRQKQSMSTMQKKMSTVSTSSPTTTTSPSTSTTEIPTTMMHEDPEVESALIFVQKQMDTTSRDGETLTVSCEATGTPNPTITWMFGEQNIMESRKYKLSKMGTVLKIFPFLNTDVGQYECIASNDKGSETHMFSVTLTESEPPIIVDPPMSANATIGQQVTLRCFAKGLPAPDVIWLFEGTRIPRRNTRYTISDNNVELTIEKVTRHDSGVFTCQAVNSVGSAVATATLLVGAELTEKVDKLLDDSTIDKIAKEAKKKVENALSSTKDQRRVDKIESPHDLRKLFKFALPLKRVDLGKAREIYEESIRLVQMHIDNGLAFDASMISPNVSYEAVLPVSYVQTLMEKSGCQTGQFAESCEDYCFFSKYRSYDGQCNNYEHPWWGVSEMAFMRLLPPRYENGFNTPVGWNKGKLYNGFEVPNARKVSRVLIGSDEITPHNHDMTLTAPALTRHSYREGAFCNRTCENADPCFNIQLEADDPKLHTGLYQKHPCMEFERNGAACGSGETSPIFQRVTYRDQLNVLTSYLDGSAIYGNSEEQALELRDLYSDHGLLRFDIVSAANKPYMPFEKDSDMDCRRNYSRENPIKCFLAGDVRANEQLGLMSMHTIFMREHNRIASKLLEVNENWDGETIFQETRKIIGAMLQHITYNDWLPKILGRATYDAIIGDYKGYNPDVNPTIANEFATAALRFAHTLINPHLFRFDKDFKEIKEGHLPLHNAFFAPERLVSEGGVDPLLRGLFAAPIKLPKPDQILNKELTEKLFNRYHQVALDLAALNIQRGRDHGLPAWTEYRKFCNLTVPKTWTDMKNIVQNDTVIAKLKSLYGVPENIDLWVGGVTEKRTAEALMGPTFACIIADQFKRLRDGDRFWYENEEVFSKSQLRQIKKVTLSKIICTNGDDIDRIQKDAFVYHGNNTQFYEKCELLPEINLNMWTTCCDAMCSSSSSLARNAIGGDEKKVKKMRKRRHQPKKGCLDEGKRRRSGETWVHANDRLVECLCNDGEVWCKTKKNI
uniref:Peroxidase n=1 Tax=Caenorhabditis japonica TaxID=281687 RepID=A0A8R1DTH4_CAEJA